MNTEGRLTSRGDNTTRAEQEPENERLPVSDTRSHHPASSSVQTPMRSMHGNPRPRGRPRGRPRRRPRGTRGQSMFGSVDGLTRENVAQPLLSAAQEPAYSPDRGRSVAGRGRSRSRGQTRISRASHASVTSGWSAPQAAITEIVYDKDLSSSVFDERYFRFFEGTFTRLQRMMTTK